MVLSELELLGIGRLGCDGGLLQGSRRLLRGRRRLLWSSGRLLWGSSRLL